MKKTLLFLGAFSFTLCMTSCGNDADNSQVPVLEYPTADSVTEEEVEETPVEEDAHQLAWNYEGIIGTTPIRMQLNYGEGENSGGAGGLEIPISGYYFYTSKNSKIPLKGEALGNGVIELTATTANGDEYFSGEFDEGMMLGDFSGSWMGNGKEIEFQLISQE